MNDQKLHFCFFERSFFHFLSYLSKREAVSFCCSDVFESRKKVRSFLQQPCTWVTTVHLFQANETKRKSNFLFPCRSNRKNLKTCSLITELQWLIVDHQWTFEQTQFQLYLLLLLRMHSSPQSISRRWNSSFDCSRFLRVLFFSLRCDRICILSFDNVFSVLNAAQQPSYSDVWKFLTSLLVVTLHWGAFKLFSASFWHFHIHSILDRKEKL